MTAVIAGAGMLLGLCLVGYLFVEFQDRNNVEKKNTRKWTDPKN